MVPELWRIGAGAMKDCVECGPKGCKGACPLPLDRGSIYPAVKQKPKQPHVDHTGPLGSPVLEEQPRLWDCGTLAWESTHDPAEGI